MLPNVSVIIPTYNYARYISKALDSIINQTYPNELIEVIIIDDGSTDNTQEVLKTYISKHGVKYIYQENRGKAHATYQAVQKCSGKYIFNLDADDLYFENKIEKTVNIFESDPQIVHVASPAQVFDDRNQVIIRNENLPKNITESTLDGNWLLKFFFDNNILYGGGSTFAARSSILKIINIPASVDMYIDEFLIMATLPHGKSYFIKETLSVWRIHGLNYSESLKSSDSKFVKEIRLLKSCESILNHLRGTDFDPHITKIYELKYITSEITLKESMDQKSFLHVLKYMYEVFFKLRLSFKILKRYHVYNRLLPTQIFLYLKKTLKNR